MNRRDFLIGNVSGLCVGGAVGALGASTVLKASTTAPPPVTPSGSAAGPAADPDLQYATLSFAQNGEDLVLRQFLQHQLHVEKPDYIDIGAWEPILSSNTYYFYRVGARGVLVEPNPAKCDKLRAVRKRDTVVNAGIAGAGSPSQADYYIIAGDGQLNTFDKEQVEKIRKRDPRAVERVIKLPLLDVNKVLADNFKTAPALFSIDTEGMDLAILEMLDFNTWRPKVFIVEANLDNGLINDDIVNLMTSKGYLLRGGNIINSVFIERKLFG